jgi:hypothetical protein
MTRWLRPSKNFFFPQQHHSMGSGAAALVHEKLVKFAEKSGVMAIERRVRNALNSGNYAEASRLRAQSLGLMRSGARLAAYSS